MAAVRRPASGGHGRVGGDRKVGCLPGFALHAELAAYVAGGLTPLEALQGATLQPGEAAPRYRLTRQPWRRGSWPDLVLLDADPLADITNTTTIRGRGRQRPLLRPGGARIAFSSRRGPSFLVAPVAAWAGQKGTVLPVVDVQVDSALQADTRYALSRDSGRHTGVGRFAARGTAGPAGSADLVGCCLRQYTRSPAAGQVKDPATYRQVWNVSTPLDSLKVSDSLPHGPASPCHRDRRSGRAGAVRDRPSCEHSSWGRRRLRPICTFY